MIEASRGLRQLLAGPLRRGVELGAGYVDFGGWVVAFGSAVRMPNGCAGPVRLWIGGGSLEPDAWWDPRPVPRIRLDVDRQWRPDPIRLAGRGSGLTPAGDDILAGYAAGLTLFHGRRQEAEEIAAVAAPRTSSLSATLLRHAARGELPEPAHRLLEDGDPEPLRRFGHSSGRALLLGLALAC